MLSAQTPVLLVDLDPQRNASRRLLEEFDGPGLSEVLMGELSLPDSIRTTRFPGLDVLPPGEKLDQCKQAMMAESLRELMIRDLVVTPARAVYPWIVLDLPPEEGGALTSGGLVASDLVVSPIMFDGDSYQGLVKVRTLLTKLAPLNPGRHIGTVLAGSEKPSTTKARPVNEQITLELLDEEGIPVLGEWTNRKSWPTSQLAGQLCWEYEPKTPGKAQVQATTDLIVRIAQEGNA